MKYNQQNIAEAFCKVHGSGTYDYSEVVYESIKAPITIICPKHGRWSTTADNHLSGKGCRQCGVERMASRSRETKEEFVRRSKEKYGEGQFDYSLVEYVNARTNVALICNEHSIKFQTQPQVHFRSKFSCPECSSTKLKKRITHKTRDGVVQEFKAIHGDRYDYSNFVYTKANTPSAVICKDHGEFKIQPSNHLKGSGCKKCGMLSKSAIQGFSQEEFIQRSKEVHPKAGYDYSQVNYTTNAGKVVIRCLEHGNFTQRASKHLEGSGCPTCAKTGFSVSKSARLYVLQAGNVTKVGITNLAVSKRITQISNTYGEPFNILHVYEFKSGQNCTDIETDILRELRAIYTGVDKKFDGYTECFYDVDLRSLTNRIEELMKQYKEINEQEASIQTI